MSLLLLFLSLIRIYLIYLRVTNDMEVTSVPPSIWIKFGLEDIIIPHPISFSKGMIGKETVDTR